MPGTRRRTDAAADAALEQRLYDRHAEMCKVFSHAVRLEILNRLRNDELAVGELAQRMGRRQSNVSQHLAMMRERGVLRSRRDGAVVYYRIANPRILDAFDILRGVLFEQIETDRSLLTRRAAVGGA